MSATTPLPEDSPLARVQRAFAAHLRDPAAHAAPGDVDPRRMRVYRELVYSNVESLLAAGLPVLRSLLGDAGWQVLVRDFLVHHRARTPLFTRLVLEFVTHLEGRRLAGRPVEGGRPGLTGEPPFAAELARYEWLETELLLSTAEIEPDAIDPEGDLVEGVPVVSPLARWLRATWPVHRLRPDWRPASPPERPTCLVLCRDADDVVRFMEVTPLTLGLLEGLSDPRSRATGREHLTRIAQQRAGMPVDRFVRAGRDALEGLRRRGVLLGTRRDGGAAGRGDAGSLAGGARGPDDAGSLAGGARRPDDAGSLAAGR